MDAEGTSLKAISFLPVPWLLLLSWTTYQKNTQSMAAAMLEPKPAERIKVVALLQWGDARRCGRWQRRRDVYTR